MRLLVASDPPVQVKTRFNEAKLLREVFKRFATGATDDQARAQLKIRIANSTQSTTHYAVADGLHHLAQILRSNTVVQSTSEAWESFKNVML
jgi:hypothetical protein